MSQTYQFLCEDLNGESCNVSFQGDCVFVSACTLSSPLLSSEFWVRPVYEELPHAASRFNLSPEAEHKRPTSNLVKIASHVKEKPRDPRNQSDHHTTMTDWLDADCPVDYLNVWFPAHWSPIVFRELQDREVKYRQEHMLWFDAPARASDTPKLINERTDAVRNRNMHFYLGSMDQEGHLPTLIGKLKIDWIDFPLDDILQQFTTLKEGILRGVFKQKAAGAWFGCRAEKAQLDGQGGLHVSQLAKEL